jgi:CheY-like chemotaxis protein
VRPIKDLSFLLLAELILLKKHNRMNPTFLVLEDIVDTLTFITRLLKQNGYVVTASCSNAQSALDAIATKEIDVCLLDISLSLDDSDRFGGIRVAEKIKQMRPHVCIIFLSAYAFDDITFKTALAITPEDIIQKHTLTSFDTNEVMKRIELTWRKHQATLAENKLPIPETTDFMMIKPKGTQEIHSRVLTPLYFADVLYAESRRDDIEIYVWRGGMREKVSIESTMKDFAEKCLASQGIRRVHDSFIFNFGLKNSWAVRTDYSKINVPKEMYGIVEIPIGRVYVESVKKYLL